MKNIITTLVLFLAATLCASAQFTFVDPNATELIIESYNEENGVDVIIPEEIDGKKVVAVHGLIEMNNVSQSMRNIFIPKSVSITGNLVEQANKPFRSAVFYGGGISSNCKPFSLESDNGEDIDNIMIINPQKEKLGNLMASTTYIFEAGDATITLSNNDKIIIRIFLYGENDRINDYKQKREIGPERFNDLMWALKQHCEHHSQVVFSEITRVDLSQLDGTFKSTTGSVKDVLFAFEDYNPANELSFGARVITKDGEYISNSIMDKADFIPTDYSGTINYHRSNTQGWNSVCLPFDIQESDFPEGTKIYTFSRVSQTAEGDCINLSRLNEGTLLEAGTPCYIWCDGKTTEWNLQLTGRTISASVEAKTVEHNGWQLIGALQTQTIGAGRYKLNADGTELGPTNSENATVTALRCYFSPTQSKTNARIAVRVDDTAAITQVSNDSCAESVRVYDLLGRTSRSHGIELRRGNIRLTF